jgi:hypothetical protein
VSTQDSRSANPGHQPFLCSGTPPGQHGNTSPWPEGLPPQIQRILDAPISVFAALKNQAPHPGAQPLTHVGFVLDRSTSMETGKSATIEGFNTQVNVVKAGARDAGETRLTMVDFATEARLRYLGRAPDALEPLSEANYIPDGWTALYDGIGLIIAELLAQPGMDSPLTATLVTIFTDGEENRSSLYSAAIVRELVQKLEATGRWTFALVGPRQGVAALARLLAIDPSNTTGFNPASELDRVDTQMRMARASASYMTSRSSGRTQISGLYDEES